MPEGAKRLSWTKKVVQWTETVCKGRLKSSLCTISCSRLDLSIIWDLGLLHFREQSWGITGYGIISYRKGQYTCLQIHPVQGSDLEGSIAQTTFPDSQAKEIFHLIIVIRYTLVRVSTKCHCKSGKCHVPRWYDDDRSDPLLMEMVFPGMWYPSLDQWYGPGADEPAKLSIDVGNCVNW